MAKKKIKIHENGQEKIIDTDLLTIKGFGQFIPEEEFFGEPIATALTFRSQCKQIGEYLWVKKIVTPLAEGGTCTWVLKEGFVQPPTRLVIVNPPTKLVYANDEDIDFTGMVVKAQYDDGTFWIDADHQDGIIPIEELELNVTKAHTDTPGDWTADSLFLNEINLDLGSFTAVVMNMTSVTIHFARFNFGKCIGVFVAQRTGMASYRYLGPILISKVPEYTYIDDNGRAYTEPRIYMYEDSLWYYNSSLRTFSLTDSTLTYQSPLDKVSSLPSSNEEEIFQYIMQMAGAHAVYTPQTIPVGWTFHDQSGNEVTLTNQFNIEVS